MLNTSEKGTLNELLNSNMLDFIDSLLDEHYNLLSQFPKYQELNKQLEEMESNLQNNISASHFSLEQYRHIINQMHVYESLILYYLGMKLGLNIQKLN